jgi:hypothetical protein
MTGRIHRKIRQRNERRGMKSKLGEGAGQTAVFVCPPGPGKFARPNTENTSIIPNKSRTSTSTRRMLIFDSADLGNTAARSLSLAF